MGLQTERTETKKEELINQLSSDIIKLSVSRLAVDLRFIQRAVLRLKPLAVKEVSLASDGRVLYYDPIHILNMFRYDENAVTRDILHTVLHLIFLHAYVGKDVRREYWDLATDISVENVINSLDLPCLNSGRKYAQLAYIKLLETEVGELTAEKICAFFRKSGMSVQEAEEIRRSFQADSHGFWWGKYDKNARKIEVPDSRVWEEVSRKVQKELEFLNKDEDSPLVQNLRAISRAKYSYTDLLRRFSVWGETLHLSDEEFDNNYYMFGLDTYGNMPLIEPLEYREQKRVRDFVIAVDTSGSVRGDMVQKFIQHTHDILVKQENFFTKVNIHIFQCDDRIRDESVIKTREDFRKYMETLEIKGLGRTDFRPVFSRVDELVSEHVFSDLKGIIYFTDGLGTFPSKKPAYETAFIISSESSEVPDLPPWAIHMTLSENQLEREMRAAV
jgi:predicted metal-dependent peptidase